MSLQISGSATPFMGGFTDDVPSLKSVNLQEQSINSFKSLQNVFNTTTFKDITQELFNKSFQIYSSDIIPLEDQIKVSSNPEFFEDFQKFNDISPRKIQTWVTNSAVFNDEANEYGGAGTPAAITASLYRGFLSESINPNGTNEFVERVILPLTQVNGTNQQFYSCISLGKSTGSIPDYTASNTDYSNEFNTPSHVGSDDRYIKLVNDQFVFDNNSKVLKHWISPQKYGASYKVAIYPSTPGDITNPVYGPSAPSAPDNSEFSNVTEAGGIDEIGGNVWGTWLFDYREGALFFTTYGDDGEAPEQKGLQHPLWIVGYRYNGPTGFSGHDINLTASNMQVDGTLNVDGAYLFQGFSFVNSTILTTSGSTIFGDSASEDTHQFTGAVSISGSLTIDGETVGGGGGGAGGNSVPTTAFSVLGSDKSEDYDYFYTTTLIPSNSNDILEYIQGEGILISGSLGVKDYFVLLGSSSNKPITKPSRVNPYTFDTSSTANFTLNDGHNWNISQDLFRYHKINDREYPTLSSLASFVTESFDTNHTTHSFFFTSSRSISKIGLYYSNNTNIDPSGSSGTANRYIEEVRFSGSIDGTTWVPIYSEAGLNAKAKCPEGSGFTPTNTNVSSKLYILGNSNSPEFPYLNNSADQEPGTLVLDAQRYILRYTSSLFNTGSENDSYQYYRLYISGGGTHTFNDSIQRDDVQFLHHIELTENLKVEPDNRKQITIGLDTSDDPDNPGQTRFQTAVSSAAAAVGFQGFVLPEDNFIVNGIAKDNIDIANFNLNNVGDIEVEGTANIDKLNVSNRIINDGVQIQKKSIFFGTNNDTYLSTLPSRSVILESLNPIYFTNRTVEGNIGVDQHSSRIFGHYTSDGVSDLYIDSYRLFQVADNEIRLTTLHPTEGTVIVSASNGLLISGNLVVNETISASKDLFSSNLFLPSDGNVFIGSDPIDLSGSPLSVIKNEYSASLTGSLIISSSEDNPNPYISLFEVSSSYFTENETDAGTGQKKLYNKNGNLMWGSSIVASPDDNPSDLVNDTSPQLGGNLDLTSRNISGSGNIDIIGYISASSITASSFSGSFEGTASVAITSSNAITSSYSITSSHALTASHALNIGSFSDFDNNSVQSNKNIRINPGDENIPELYLNNTKSLHISSDKLVIGEEKLKRISFEIGDNSTKFVIKNDLSTDVTSVGIGNSEPVTASADENILIVKGDISASNDVYFPGLTSDTTNNFNPIVWDNNTGRLYTTSSAALGGGGNIISDNDGNTTYTLTTGVGSSNNAIISLTPSDDSGTDTVTIAGTSNEITVTETVTDSDAATITIGLPNNVDIDNTLTVAGTTTLNGHVNLGSNTSDNITVNGVLTVNSPNTELGKTATNELFTARNSLIVSGTSGPKSAFFHTGLMTRGDIIPNEPFTVNLGSRKLPFKDAYIGKGTLYFLSGSTQESGSDHVEKGKIEVDDKGNFSFKSGSVRRSVTASSANFDSTLVVGNINSNTGNVQVRGQNDLILRPGLSYIDDPSPVIESEKNLHILLNSGQQHGDDALFTIGRNATISGFDTKLFTVSSSGHTQIYGNLNVDGDVTTNRLIISSSVSHITQSFSSGSTIFGDDTSDTHQFTGSILVSGSNLQLNGSNVLTTLQTGSFVVNSQTGSFVVNSQTSSFLTSLPSNIVSSSSQLAEKISGSFNGITSSFALVNNVVANSSTSSFALVNNVVANSSTSSFITEIPNGTYSSSLQILTNITSSGNISASGDLHVSNVNLPNNGAVIGGASTKLALVADDYWQFFANHAHPSLTIMNLNVIVNENLAAIDFKVKGDNDTNLLFTDASEDKVAIGTGTVGNSLLTVDGDITLTHITSSGNISASGIIVGSNLSGTNTGDQNLEPYLLSSNTSSFVTNSQTGSFLTAIGNIDGGSF